ncbi:hypothetical protein MTP10_09990 [Nonomuraea sp. 3-1Str]|uniref:hypothetical protein n=1 Tax=Nonomuraea sp. 3-1Str TaxID=2929801 RepID=UPI00285B5B5E|nr:hypothetical protein [Nonomuraea sp. 3-1Str]MDR8409069.1 hypothetical protein [Nonomuraea sp. 3-1Str]
MRGYDILDPGTCRYLGTRTVWLRDPFPFGRGGEPIARKGAAWSTALMSSVIVDRPGQRG